MATTKKRINISLSSDVEEAVSSLAKRDQVPAATKAGELLRRALELEEDEILEKIASLRDTKDAKFVFHDDVWK